ncbi:hypothetical protein SAMN05421737_10576 [Shouchella lonarensis]|uniref:Uncharacterized protein n=1 Tax=Shouchella lonarensis TaxID=1464122 RepID=A0A1G6IIE2_9BACI|nr:hypothetical protein SAMN05421737_10576 [Shouchella lonarensis]
MEDMHLMTVGMCLDYMDEYIQQNSGKTRTRKATQADYDSF